MKICTECTHCEQTSTPPKCHHPLALVRRDIVSGVRTYREAWYMRAESGSCGPAANLHTPHGPITRLILSLFGAHDA